MNRLTKLANSPQGRKLAEKAKDVANDPKTKAKIEDAKRKLAERRGGGADKPADPPPPPAA
ncbi:MAG TPA: hypothetical protein VMY78_12085 [Solirubrobacteraceae bacterium]|nr:hypothetical protein [Solirubrobacteraceae bacterium]